MKNKSDQKNNHLPYLIFLFSIQSICHDTPANNFVESAATPIQNDINENSPHPTFYLTQNLPDEFKARLRQVQEEIYNDWILCPNEVNHYWDDTLRECVPTKSTRTETELYKHVTSPDKERENNSSDESVRLSQHRFFFNSLFRRPDYSLEAQSIRLQRRTFVTIRTFRKVKMNITCPELYYTFTNAPPFDVIGIPECESGVQPKMALYVKDNPACFLNTSYIPNEKTTDCFNTIVENNRNSSRTRITKVVLVTHGFLKSFDEEWLHDLQRRIMKFDPGTAVIIIGWGHGRGDLLDYYRAAANSRYLGYLLYKVIKEMHEIVRAGTSQKLYVHCAAHSLGSHGCGFAGKHLNADDRSIRLNRISAFDPAGPMFANDIAYPFNDLNITSGSRLSRSDADYVDAIHTDGEARYLSYVPQYGTMEPFGTVDFYPGSGSNYGHDMLGCYDIFNIISCSHSRAWQIYVSSVSEASCLASQKCVGKPHQIPNDCAEIDKNSNKGFISMGYWWDAKGVFGSEETTKTSDYALTTDENPSMYTVDVQEYAPFCVNRFQHERQVAVHDTLSVDGAGHDTAQNIQDDSNDEKAFSKFSRKYNKIIRLLQMIRPELLELFMD